MRWTKSILGLQNRAGFIAGNAPAHWREELREKTTRLDDLRTAANWIGSLRTAEEMMLCKDPLLGCALEELMQSSYQKEEEPEQTSRLNGKSKDITQGIEISTSKERTKPRLKRSMQSGSTKVNFLPKNIREITASDKIHTPLKMDKRASRELLSHFASEADTAGDLVPNQSGFVKVPGQKNGVSPKVFWDKEMHRVWLRDMASRAFGSVLQKELESLPATLASIARLQTSENRPLTDQWNAQLSGKTAPTNLLDYLADHFGKNKTEFDQNTDKPSSSKALQHRIDDLSSTQQFVPKTIEDSPLANQWQVPLNGQRAPVNLLSCLANPSFKNHTESYNNHRHDSLPETAGSRDAKHASSSKPQGSHPVRNESKIQSVPAMLPSVQLLGVDLQPIEQAASKLFGASDRILDIGEKPQIYSRIAPPKAALSLPDLIPPQTKDMPSFPVAAALAGNNAKLEAETGTDDNLNILAAKVKRILDEEARRHGIYV
jgi:hypothetical protein